MQLVSCIVRASSPSGRQEQRRSAAARLAFFPGEIILVFSVLFHLIFPASAAGGTEPRNVLILLSAQYGLPAYDVILHEIRSTLRAGIVSPLNLYAEYMDMARFSSEHHEQALLEFYKRKYGAVEIDLLIALGPNLASASAMFNDQLFAETPTVIVELAERDADLPSLFRKPNMTGVFPDVDIPKAIETAIALHPGTKRLLVIAGASAFGLSLLDQAKRACPRYAGTVEVDYLSPMAMETILSVVSRLPDHSLVLFTGLQKDAAGVMFYTREATRLVAARSNAPVFVLFDTNVDVGALGGYVVSFKQVGIEAAKMALRVLNGENPAEIPPLRQGLHQYQFDWRQIARWKIPEHRLPEGSRLLNREVSFFERYFLGVMGVLMFFALQAGLIAYLVILNRRQNALSMKLRKAEGRYRELLRMERSARLGEMTGSLAHELNQPLAAILSSAQAALRFLDSGKTEIGLHREILQHIVKDDKRAASIIRGIRAMLKKEVTDYEPVSVNAIVAEVVTIFHGEAVILGTRVETDLGKVLPPVMASQTQLQQVLLNLIMNAAQAVAPNRPDRRKVVLATRTTGQRVKVSVRDDGAGIAPEHFTRLFEPLFTTKPDGMGMGLAVCRAIIEDHGGRIWAENNPDGGATFTIELPAVADG